jgi:hypothetical protein
MTLEEQFEQFWQQFPRGRKTAKPDAWRKFKAICTGKHRDLKATPEQLILGAMQFRQAVGDNYRFVPKPSTWLNQGRWMDEDLPKPSGRHTPLEQKLTDRSWAK